MATIYGTHYFVSRAAAVKYYKSQESDAVEVDRKIKDGEIAIGRPEVPPGCRLLTDEDGRLHIEAYEGTDWPGNAALTAQMINEGYQFKRNGWYEHFIDAEGKYVEYPIGYIRGPYCDRSSGNPRPWCVSVKGPGGWHQRSFRDGQMEKMKQWAIETQIYVLKTVVAE